MPEMNVSYSHMYAVYVCMEGRVDVHVQYIYVCMYVICGDTCKNLLYSSMLSVNQHSSTDVDYKSIALYTSAPFCNYHCV